MLAHQESLIVLISLQPPHVQHDPVGESRDSVFIRRFVGTSRVKTLAVPADQPIHLMEIAYPIVETRWKNGCFKKFEDP